MDALFDLEKTFKDLGLDDEIVAGLEEKGFQHPTRIQAELIPAALTGRDLLGQSKTGTGKTVAFGLPILQMADDTPLQALILVPTRELAIQVTRELHDLARHRKLKVVAIYGGQRINVQAEKLKKDPHIIVGTPGRVMDMHQRGLLLYDNIRFAVLDEVDRMLDIGFRDDIRRILGKIQHEHQTMFVSATISPEIEKLARRFMDDAERIDVSGAKSLTVAQVTQWHLSVEPWDKKRLLVMLLKREKPPLTLVFCRTKQTVDALTQYLKKKNIEAHAMHGDMYQRKRNRVMDKLRAGELRVLVASDLAARGLDVDNISHVVNYDLPEDPEVYVHRIGRTARAGREGTAWSFVTPDGGKLLSAIEKLTNVEIQAMEYPDFEPGPVPKHIAEARKLAAERGEEYRQKQARTVNAPPTDEDARDTERFPGGVVPAEVPERRMGGRLRLRRR